MSHVGLDGSLAVDGVTEGVNDSAEHALTDGDIHDGTGSLDNITLLDLSIIKKRLYTTVNQDGALPEIRFNLPIVTEDDNTNIISFQVEGHTLDT